MGNLIPRFSDLKTKMRFFVYIACAIATLVSTSNGVLLLDDKPVDPAVKAADNQLKAAEQNLKEVKEEAAKLVSTAKKAGDQQVGSAKSAVCNTMKAEKEAEKKNKEGE